MRFTGRRIGGWAGELKCLIRRCGVLIGCEDRVRGRCGWWCFRCGDRTRD